MKYFPRKLTSMFPYLFWFYFTALIILTVVPSSAMDVDLLAEQNALPFRWDYVLHALAYIPLPLLMDATAGKRFKRKRFLKIVLISLILALILEFSQLFLSYRTFNLKDLVSNVVGVLLGYLLVSVFHLNRVLNAPVR